jgi:hypothetical protein
MIYLNCTMMHELTNLKSSKDVTSGRLVYYQVHFRGTELFRNVTMYLPVDKHRCEELRALIKQKIHGIPMTMTRRPLSWGAPNSSQQCLSTDKYLLTFRKKSVPPKWTGQYTGWQDVTSLKASVFNMLLFWTRYVKLNTFCGQNIIVFKCSRLAR